MLNNNDYTIPQFYATDYANGGIKVLSTVTIKDAGYPHIPSVILSKPVVNNNWMKFPLLLMLMPHR